MSQPMPGQLKFTSKNTMEMRWRIDWQTPDKYIYAARDVMGDIDLDPISSDRANARVNAKTYYTEESDGLKHDWTGRIWLNPAYEILPECVQKLIMHYDNDDIEEAILFTHTLTTWEPWFQDALRSAEVVCFIDELVEWYAGHTPELPLIHEFGIDPIYDVRGTIAAYYGPHKDAFCDVFRQFGAIK